MILGWTIVILYIVIAFIRCWQLEKQISNEDREAKSVIIIMSVFWMFDLFVHVVRYITRKITD